MWLPSRVSIELIWELMIVSIMSVLIGKFNTRSDTEDYWRERLELMVECNPCVISDQNRVFVGHYINVNVSTKLSIIKMLFN